MKTTLIYLMNKYEELLEEREKYEEWCKAHERQDWWEYTGRIVTKAEIKRTGLMIRQMMVEQEKQL